MFITQQLHDFDMKDLCRKRKACFCRYPLPKPQRTAISPSSDSLSHFFFTPAFLLSFLMSWKAAMFYIAYGHGLKETVARVPGTRFISSPRSPRVSLPQSIGRPGATGELLYERPRTVGLGGGIGGWRNPLLPPNTTHPRCHVMSCHAHAMPFLRTLLQPLPVPAIITNMYSGRGEELVTWTST